MFKYDADHPYIQYTGRMDFSNPKSALMPYPGSYIMVKFKGTSVKLRFSQNNIGGGNYMGYIIDDVIEGKIQLKMDTVDEEYELVNGLDNKEHELTIIKRNDFQKGNCWFNGIMVDGELLEPKKRPNRRIECFGDSVTAGACTEAYDYVGKPDPVHQCEFDNGWYSWANILARLLDADVHNNGQGGLSLVDGAGYYCSPHTIGLESTYDKLNPVPYMGGLTPWDFRNYIPQLVIIAIGQNDSSTTPNVPYDWVLREHWKTKYKKIVFDLQSKYKNPYFIFTTTLLGHDLAFDEMIEEIAREINDPKIIYYRYKRAGIGTPGHLRKSEEEEMAQELKVFIDSFINWDE